MEEVFSVRVPSQVIRNGVNPFVEGRVELSDDVLFPLGADKSEKNFGLVDGIL